MRLQGRAVTTCLVLLVVLGAAGLLALMLGTAALSPGDVWAALWRSSSGVERQIVWNLRLPRMLVGALAGLNLAVAGVLLQAVMQNPLASPNIVGVTAGAGLAATLVLVVAPGWPTFLPVAAFAGALTTALIVYAVSWLPGTGTSTLRMVLAGVAISSLLGAVTTFVMIIYSDRVSSVVLWMAGTLNGRSWQHLNLIWPYSVGGLTLALLLIRPLNLLLLGEEAASGLGLPVELVRGLAILTASVLAGAAVSVSGMIGFVGLVIPHIVRMVVGHNHGAVLPTAAIGGAALVVAADLTARTVISPTELPVGILIALIGGPYFLFLLYRTKLLG